MSRPIISGIIYVEPIWRYADGLPSEVIEYQVRYAESVASYQGGLGFPIGVMVRTGNFVKRGRIYASFAVAERMAVRTQRCAKRADRCRGWIYIGILGPETTATQYLRDLQAIDFARTKEAAPAETWRTLVNLTVERDYYKAQFVKMGWQGPWCGGPTP